jgi:hypothetical protein
VPFWRVSMNSAVRSAISFNFENLKDEEDVPHEKSPTQEKADQDSQL